MTYHQLRFGKGAQENIPLMSTKCTSGDTYKESVDGYKKGPRVSWTSYCHGNEQEAEELAKSAFCLEKPRREPLLRVSY